MKDEQSTPVKQKRQARSTARREFEANEIRRGNDDHQAEPELSVLLVGSDPSSRQLIQQTLNAMGHLVTEVCSCNDAWTVLQAVNFDVVVLDIETAAIAPMELARRVQATRPTTTVVATSPNIGPRSRLVADLCDRNGIHQVVPISTNDHSLARNLGQALAPKLPSKALQ